MEPMGNHKNELQKLTPMEAADEGALVSRLIKIVSLRYTFSV